MPASALIDRRDMTLQEFADRFQYSRSTAVRLTSQPREVYLEKARRRHEKIWALRQEGLSYREIASRLGVSLGAVSYALQKTDIPATTKEHPDTVSS